MSQTSNNPETSDNPDTRRSHRANLREVNPLHIATTRVSGTAVKYTTGGAGDPVLFLHGWGLGHHAYRRAMRALIGQGYEVFAPALPGFGGTKELASDDETFPGYSAWVGSFCEAVGLRRPLVVGHSFGGGVATRFAVDAPVRGVVLLNAVGGRWQRRGEDAAMQSRPWWDWSRRVPSDVVALTTHFGSTMPSVLEDLLPNVVRNPLGVAKVGKLARNADLTTELSVLRTRNVPVLAVHSRNDGVIPECSFVSICEVLGQSGKVVGGNHSWPLTHPETFVDTVHGFLTNTVIPSEATAVATSRRRARYAVAR